MRSTAWRRIVRFERPRKSNLSRPNASTPCISYWVMTPSEFVAFCSGISSVSGSRLMTTPAACVDALRATPSRCRAKSMTRATCGSASYMSLSCRAQGQGLFELDAELVGHRLGDAVAVAVAHVQDARHVPDGGPGQHRAKGDDLGHVVRAVLAADVVDDLFAAPVLEVHVDIGHRHAVGIEEALERQLVVDRVHRRDAQGVGHDAAGGGAADGDGDALLAGEAGEVGHDQEVARVAHAADDFQLVVQARLQFGRDRAVAARQAGLAFLAQPGFDRLALGHREARDPELAERQLHVHRLGDGPGTADGVQVVREERRHLGRRLEVELGRLEAEALVVSLTLVPGADAQQDVVRLVLIAPDVVQVVGDDEVQAHLPPERDQLGVQGALLGQPVVLQLKEEALAAEDLLVDAGRLAGQVPVVHFESLGDLAAQAGRRADQALRVAGQMLVVDAGLVVVALEVSVGDQPAEVLVALPRSGPAGPGGRAGRRPCPPCRACRAGPRTSRRRRSA